MVTIKLLSQSEVDALPAGSQVKITWSGGNGPHLYSVIKNKYGESCVDNSYQDRIDFVGNEMWHTKVEKA